MRDNFFPGFGSELKWRKMKNNDKDIFPAEDMLRDLEDNYVSACARFLSRDINKDPVWMLNGKKKESDGKSQRQILSGLIISNKSTIIPVLAKNIEIPKPKFLGSFFQINKIHSIQGLKEEVIILEDTMIRSGKKISEIIDYDLMSLDYNSGQCAVGSVQQNLVLRVPGLSDLDALAPLQAAYEHEEVLHKGSVFSAAASRVNLGNIITNGKILAAELSGRMVGKINVSGISFTRYLVGGVFVHPEFRGKGIAGQMTARFISSLLNEGRGITLFVKKANVPAKKLYSGLGFKVIGDYRITYFYS